MLGIQSGIGSWLGLGPGSGLGLGCVVTCVLHVLSQNSEGAAENFVESQNVQM